MLDDEASEDEEAVIAVSATKDGSGVQPRSLRRRSTEEKCERAMEALKDMTHHDLYVATVGELTLWQRLFF